MRKAKLRRVGYDCMDAGGRAMQEQLPRRSFCAVVTQHIRAATNVELR